MVEILEKTWWVNVLRGVVAILFGLFALLNPSAAFDLLLLLFGIFILIDGILNILASIAYYKTSENWWISLLVGVLEIAVAVATFVRPDIVGIVALVLIGTWALFKGLVELLAGIALRKEIEGEWILILSGILSMLTGVFAYLFAFTDNEGFMLLLGLYAVVWGVLLLILGFAARRWAKELRQASEEVAV